MRSLPLVFKNEHETNGQTTNVKRGRMVQVFLSLRFGEAMEQAKMVKSELEKQGVSCFLCVVHEGENIARIVADNLCAAELFVVFGTRTYGTETGTPCNTADELAFIKNEKKPYFLIKMCEKFEDSVARMYFTSSVFNYPWMPKDHAVLPKDLVSRIIEKLRAISPAPKAVEKLGETTVQQQSVEKTSIKMGGLSLTETQNGTAGRGSAGDGGIPRGWDHASTGQVKIVSIRGPTIDRHAGYGIQNPAAHMPSKNRATTQGMTFNPYLSLQETTGGGVKPWKMTKTLEGHSESVGSVIFHPEGGMLASASGDKTVKLWDVRAGKELQTLEGHSHHVNSVRFHPEGGMLASGSVDCTIKLWDVRTGKDLQTLKNSSSVNSVSFHPEGKMLASASNDMTIKLWDVRAGKELQTLKGHSDRVCTVSFHPEGRILASGSHDMTVKLWDVHVGKELQTLKGDSGFGVRISFHPKGGMLASSFNDTFGGNKVILWDVRTGKELQTLKNRHSSYVWSVSFHPEGGMFASGSHDKTVKLWDVRMGKVLQTLNNSSSVSSVSFHPEGKMLASSDDKKVKLWETE